MKKVVILGGGVAGLSAAHELIERGFEVHVYEKKSLAGGKARSIPVPNTGVNGRKDLPGEHGFRFFPGFYRHIMDTMKRIPFDAKHTVFDQIVPTTETGIAHLNRELVRFEAGKTYTLQNIKANIKAYFEGNWDLTENEILVMVERVWQILTSCRERIMDEYERISWWDFVNGDRQTNAYQKMASVITRSLVAAKAKEASAKTVGTVLSQIILDIVSPTQQFDRVLNGPTNERWIDPWLRYLTQRGVQYFTDAEVVGLTTNNDRIHAANVRIHGAEKTVKGDYFLAAMPVEVMDDIITKEILQIDPTLMGVKQLSKSVDWMNGIQFYLKRDLPFVHGHLLFIDSPWAITAISQRQFWSQVDLEQYGDGTVKGIISVDISEWNVPGFFVRKKAIHCTKEEIKKEVWHQLKRSLRKGEMELLDTDLHSWFLDPDITSSEDGKMYNLEPLLINKINTWCLRPYAHTRIANLFLASDYVRTATDLATMEGANEAARRAVNAILDVSRCRKAKCMIWPMYQFDLFLPFQLHDKRRYRLGLPWSSNSPLLTRLHFCLTAFRKSCLLRKKRKI